MKAYSFEQDYPIANTCSISGSGSSGSGDSSQTSGNSPAVRNAAASQIFENVGRSRNLLNEFLAQDTSVPLTAQGLTQGASSQAGALVRGAAENLFNQQSSTVAQRGGLSPRNTEGIIADAASRAASAVLPTTLAQAQQNEQAGAQARSNQLAQGVQLSTAVDALLASLTQGSEGESSQSQNSFGFGFLG